MARDQTQPGSFSRERKAPGNEVNYGSVGAQPILISLKTNLAELILLIFKARTSPLLTKINLLKLPTLFNYKQLYLQW